MKLEHIAFNVNEPAKMAQWYADNLGMRIVIANDDAPYIHFLADEAGSMIEIYSNPAGEIPDYSSISPFTLHLAFTSDDVSASRDKLIAAGATAEGDINLTPAGDQLLFLRDPWGVTLQILKRKTPLI